MSLNYLYSFVQHWLSIKSPEGFSSSSTAEQVADRYAANISGKTFLVTGCTNGIGLETAKALVKAGGNLIMACRNPTRMEEVSGGLRKINAAARINSVTLDLASLKSVTAAIEEVKKLNITIDCIITNAGMQEDKTCVLTEDGVERTFESNVLGHHHLVTSLVPLLKKAKEPRIVVVASEAHRLTLQTKIDYDDIKAPAKPHQVFRAYCASKLANMLQTRVWHEQHGGQVLVVCLHPGCIITNIVPAYLKSLAFLAAPFTKSMAQGASTTLFCAASPASSLKGGAYYADCRECHAAASAVDDVEARKLNEQCNAIISFIEARDAPPVDPSGEWVCVDGECKLVCEGGVCRI